MPDMQTAEGVASSLRLSRRRSQRLRSMLDHPGADLAQRPQHYLHYNGAACVSDQAAMALAEGQISPGEAGSVLALAAEWVAPGFPLRGSDMAPRRACPKAGDGAFAGRTGSMVGGAEFSGQTGR